MRVFVSSQAVDKPPASVLLGRLRANGWTVSHSPSNPLDADDPRWPDWYERGLPSALADADLFIAVIDEAWDSSTWMAIEADMARRRQGPGLPCYSWNPHDLRIVARGMMGYLAERLPRGVEEAVAMLEERRSD
jgi:hypothetical protein